MNLKEYTRDAGKVLSGLKELSGVLVATKTLKMYVPRTFEDKRLISLGNETFVVGIYMLAAEDRYYAVSLTTAMLRTEPSSVNTVYLDGVEMYELLYEPGDMVVSDLELVVNGKLIYAIYDEIFALGRVPPYLSYLDIGRLFESAPKYANVSLASTPTILQMLGAVISRDPDNPMTYFRQVTNGKDLDKAKYVSLKSSTHSATNTTARLMGAYFSDNLTTALVHPSEREENVERLLRQ